MTAVASITSSNSTGRRPVFEQTEDYILAALIIIGVGGGLLLYLTGEVAGLIFEFAWPRTSLGQTLEIAKALPGNWHDPKMAWPVRARADLPGLTGFILAALIVISGFTGAGVLLLRLLTRRSRRRDNGFASGVEVSKTMSTKAVLRSASAIRPSLERGAVELEEVGAVWGRRIPGAEKIAVSAEESVIVMAAPRQGKTSQVMIPLLHRWRGPAVATTIRRDLVDATASLRKLRGPVHVLAPTGIRTGLSGVRWSPAAGCENLDVAAARAAVIVTVGKGGAAEDSAATGFFGPTATNLVLSWLHAAALIGGSMMDVLDWVLNQNDDTPVRLLRDHPDAQPGVAGMLAHMYAEPPVTKSNLWSTAMIGLAPLLSRSAQEVFCCPVAESMDLREFVRSQGTIYILVSKKKAGPLAPLISCFTEEVLEEAKDEGDSTIAGRLDPAMLFAADEAANVVPLPSMADFLSYSGGSGVHVVLIFQNMAQVKDKWGPVGAEMIWSASTVKVVLGGLSGPEVDDLCTMAGEYMHRYVSVQRGSAGTTIQTSYQHRPVLVPADIRGLSKERREALIFHGSAAPVLVRMVRAHEGPDRKLYQAAVRDARDLLEAYGAISEPKDDQ